MGSHYLLLYSTRYLPKQLQTREAAGIPRLMAWPGTVSVHQSPGHWWQHAHYISLSFAADGYRYCWWLKSQTTTWDVLNPVNDRINYLSTGAGFQPSTIPTNKRHVKMLWVGSFLGGFKGPLHTKLTASTALPPYKAGSSLTSKMFKKLYV